jgi:hypothetical protein
MSEPLPNAAFRIGPRTGMAIAALLLLQMAWLADQSLAWKSPTFDETAGLVAGFSTWSTGDPRLDAESGMLAKRWAALPAWLSGAAAPDFSGEFWRVAFDWQLARDFLYASGNDPDTLMRGARRMILVFTVLLGALVYAWSAHLFGPAGGLISLWLFTFSPNLIAHGRLVTSDMALCLTLVASIGTTWAAFQRVTPLRVAACATTVALLFLSKFGALIAIPMFLLMLVLRAFDPEPLPIGRGSTRSLRDPTAKISVLLGILVIAAAVTIAAIWAAYGFAFRTTYGDFTAYNWARVETLDGIAARLVVAARDLHALPETWLYGLGYTLATIQDRIAFAAGSFSMTGWWWFFPYAVAIKTPLGTLAVLALAALAGVSPWVAGRRAAPPVSGWVAIRRSAPLWILILVFWAASLPSNINIGLRHVLPTYAPAFVLAGAAIRFTSRRGGALLLAALLAATAAESLAVRPHYLAYFNPLGGGPGGGHQRLVDSNLDWGQDLPGLARWLADRRAAGDDRPCFLSYFGSALPEGHGVRCLSLPSFFDFHSEEPPPALAPGVYAISASMLQALHLPAEIQGAWTPEREERVNRLGDWILRAPADDGNREVAIGLESRMRFARLLAALREREPDHDIGHSILIYDLDEAALGAALHGPLRALSDASR